LFWLSGIVPIYCENLFKQVDEKKAAGVTDDYEVSYSQRHYLTISGFFV